MTGECSCAVSSRIFIRFLYRCPPPHLENLCLGWHFIARSKARSFARDEVRADARSRSIQMLDIILLALGLGLFALTVGYTYACERL